jgi:hypothetical protein
VVRFYDKTGFGGRPLMGLTLHLEDALTEELRQEASQEHVSVE